MPKILFTILSGSNTSSPSSFSEVPINLIGTFVKCLADKATPPLVSPSNLVKIVPVSGSLSLNPLITLIASWPIILSNTSNISSGLNSSFNDFNSFINSSSTWSLPAVSINI